MVGSVAVGIQNYVHVPVVPLKQASYEEQDAWMIFPSALDGLSDIEARIRCRNLRMLILAFWDFFLLLDRLLLRLTLVQS